MGGKASARPCPLGSVSSNTVVKGGTAADRDRKIENFIRTKYESKRWVMDGPMPDPSTLDDEADDDIVSHTNAYMGFWALLLMCLVFSHSA